MPIVHNTNHVRINQTSTGSYQFHVYDNFFDEPFTFKLHDDCIEFKRAIFTDKKIIESKKAYKSKRFHITSKQPIIIGHFEFDEVIDEDIRTISYIC